MSTITTIKKQGINLFISSFLAIFILFGCSSAAAAEDPIKMLEGVTSQVMTVLKENKEDLKRNPNKIYEVVNRYILPHADFTEMAKWVVGRNAWSKASPTLQQSFVAEFKTLVIRSYAQSLLSYNNQTIEFLPLRSSANKERVQVSSMIKQPGKKSTRIDYRLLQDSGTWKVYDIIIEGVSLMQGYHAQFAEDVQRGGVAAVVEKLRGHNKGKGGKGKG